MPTTSDDAADLADLAAGRGALVACALGLLIATWVPVTRWAGEWEDTNGPLQEDVPPPVLLHNLWDLGGAGDVSGPLVALSLAVLAALCLAAVYRDGVLRVIAPVAGLVLMWAALHMLLGGLEGELTSARWLCLAVPAVTVLVGARTHAACRRVFA